MGTGKIKQWWFFFCNVSSKLPCFLLLFFSLFFHCCFSLWIQSERCCCCCCWAALIKVSGNHRKHDYSPQWGKMDTLVSSLSLSGEKSLLSYVADDTLFCSVSYSVTGTDLLNWPWYLCEGKPINESLFSHSELHQTQPVPAQSLCAHTERGNRKKLLVDAEPRGRKEWKVTSTQSYLHGQQQ